VLKVIIFGAGYNGKCCYEKLKKHFEILFFVDNNPSAVSPYEGLKVHPLHDYFGPNWGACPAVNEFCDKNHIAAIPIGDYMSVAIVKNNTEPMRNPA